MHRLKAFIKKIFPHQSTTRKNTFPDIDVIILSGGKTGTSTLAKAFNRAGFKAIQAHDNSYFRNIIQRGIQDPVNLDSIIENNKARKKKTIVVTVYREPLSRSISSFFQYISKETEKEEYESSVYKHDIKFIEKNFDIQEIIANFNENYLLRLENYHPYKDISTYCHIDIFEKPFSWETFYSVHETDHVTLIALRFDKIAQWEQTIKQVLSLENFRIGKENVGSNKVYYRLYNQFKEKCRIHQDLLDLMFEHNKKYLTYFYSNEELASLRRAWEEKSLETHFFPADFNGQRYLSLNQDLWGANIRTETEAQLHFYLYGRKENRPY